MDIANINQALVHGNIESVGVLPHLDSFKLAAFQFNIDFGLMQLPLEPGLLVLGNMARVRGSNSKLPTRSNNGKAIWRKPCKYHFVNTLAAVSYHPLAPRTPQQLEESPALHGQIMEWYSATICLDN